MDQYLLSGLSGAPSAGYFWDKKTLQRLEDPLCLDGYGYKVYSQSDEDGILAEIFARIGTSSKRFIEFGVQDGLECNTHLLLHKGWRGLWLEGDAHCYRALVQKFGPVIDSGQLQADCVYVTRENVNTLFAQHGFSGEIDLLSVDIDGNDYHVLEAVDVVSPRVIVLEYNGKFPPDVHWVMAHNPYHAWSGTDRHGASLNAFSALCDRKGYQLVGTNVIGVNAFFVRKDLLQDKFVCPATPEALYNPCRMWMRYQCGHPADTCLAVQREGIAGSFAHLPTHQTFLAINGFHTAEYQGEQFGVQWMSDKQAMLFVRADSSHPKELVLKVLCEHNTRMEVKLDGQSVCDEQLGAGDVSEKRFAVDNRPGDPYYRIDLSISNLWSPAETKQSDDSRTLGLGLLKAYII